MVSVWNSCWLTLMRLVLPILKDTLCIPLHQHLNSDNVHVPSGFVQLPVSIQRLVSPVLIYHLAE